MLGTVGAAWIAFVLLLFTAALAVSVGAFACLVFRLSWGRKAALTDAAFAAVVAVITAYIAAEIEASRHVWASTGMLVLEITLGLVALRHLLRFAFHSTRKFGRRR